MSKHKSANARRAARDAKALELKDTPIVSLKLGNHQFPVFTALHAAFGADATDYPDLSEIPDEFQSHHNRFARVFSGLFYSGGSLSDHGLKLKEGVDRASFYTTLRALMCSFAPKHEVKEATCAWLLAEHTEAA